MSKQKKRKRQLNRYERYELLSAVVSTQGSLIAQLRQQVDDLERVVYRNAQATNANFEKLVSADGKTTFDLLTGTIEQSTNN